MKKSIIKLLAGVTMFTIGMSMMTPIKASAASDVKVNLSTKYQTIRGFGGMNHPVWISDLTESQRNTAFNNGDNQLGFSILRIHVDENKNNWSKELATAKAAIARGAIVFATPWNPPSSMTEPITKNGQKTKRLKHDKYGEYAAYLNEFLAYMKSNGVDIYAISIQNEPDYAFEWTWWEPEEIYNFTKNYAGKINCKVISAESFNYTKSYYDKILNDPAALNNIDIVGTHFYGTTPNNMAYPLFQQKGQGKELWMTEVYVPNSNEDADKWPGALEVSNNMNNAMLNNFQTYVWWYIRRSYSPIKENGQISKRGYCMAQFSKFVRPGYVRVDATKNPTSNVSVSAYTGDGNKAVIVAVNNGNSDVNQNFALSNGQIKSVDRYRTSQSENLAKTANMDAKEDSFWANLPAKSVTTFVVTLNNSSSNNNSGSNNNNNNNNSNNNNNNNTTPSNPGTSSSLSDGWYYIKNVHAQKYLTVKDNNGKANQNVELVQGSGIKGQKWYLKNVGNGYITLQSGLGNFMLDVANGTNKDGTNILIYNAYSGNAQQFALKATLGKNVFGVTTKVSNGAKALDDYNFGTSNGANVCQWTYTGSNNQLWVFEPVK